MRIKGFKIGGKGGKGEVNATIYIVDSTTGMVLASKSVVGTHKRKGLGVGSGWPRKVICPNRWSRSPGGPMVDGARHRKDPARGPELRHRPGDQRGR